MKTSLLTLSLILALPLSSFAAKTKGLEGLKRYNCITVSETGILEQVNPIGNTVLAENRAQAVALYLNVLQANMANEEVWVYTTNVHTGETVGDALKAVQCATWKP